MYAVIRRYTVTRGSMNELVREVEQGFLPLVSQIPDFISYELLVEGDDAFSTISVFGSEAGTRESTRQAGEFVRDQLRGFEMERRDTVEGAVRVHREAALAGAR